MECIGYGSNLTNGIIMEEITAILYVSFYINVFYYGIGGWYAIQWGWLESGLKTVCGLVYVSVASWEFCGFARIVNRKI